MSTDEDVAAFLYLYEKIQTSTKGNLNQIGFLYRNNESFRAACCDLHWKASILRRRVEDSGDKVIENVDPKFIAGWRNYHRDISPKIDPLVSADFLKGLGLGIDEDALSEDELDAKTAEHPIDPVNEEVVEKLQMIRTRYEIGNSERIPDIEMMSEHKLMEGENNLRTFLGSIGLDDFGLLFGKAMYRSHRLELVHIPRHVSSKYGQSDFSLTTYLRDAQRAFVIGAPMASLALCRTISEIIIRDHYKIGDPTSNELTPRMWAADSDLTAHRMGADRQLVGLVQFSSKLLHGRLNDKSSDSTIAVNNFPQSFKTVQHVTLHWLNLLARTIEGTPVKP